MGLLLSTVGPSVPAPAAGAETSQIVIGTGVIGTLTLVLLALGLAHRSGRSALLDRAAAPLVRRTGLPAWAVLPPVVSAIGFLAAGPGLVWDVALHIDQGRDAGPFANPSHYGLIVGTFSFFAAGWLAICMPRGREAGPASVRLAPGWYAPAAGAAMLGAGAFSLTGFPLDDVWHNLFGQDVTLWGPTHLMMITGGFLHFVAAALLIREGRLAVRGEQGERGMRPIARPGLVLTGAVALTALTIAFQQEFGYGVPQFSLVFQPMLIALSAALVLVPVRVIGGCGAALWTTLGAVALNGALTLTVVGLGETTLHFPLYLAEAALVEVAALALLGGARRPVAFGVASGVLLGTLGVLAEYGWSHAWMPLAWPAHVLPEAVALSVAVAVCGGLVGVYVALAARAGARRFDAPPPRAWLAATCVMIVALAVLATELPTTAPDARGTITLGAVNRDGEAPVTVRFTPSGTVEDADWLYVMAWQGREHRRVAEPLERVAPGVYRTSASVPVGGSWKTMIRFHRGAEMASLPVSLPADAAIPAPAIPARPEVTRTMVKDSKLLQRERKGAVDGPLWPLAAAAVAGAVVTLLGLILWTLSRLAAAAVSQAPLSRGPRLGVREPAAGSETLRGPREVRA
ncbi:MAG TPA: hypothetical protein VN238_00410 [Solirubrobacteraceae bacterium]|nr:hypothetical protein [Solirubrobacteraceae bacterium]